ncbi:2,6-dihydroxypyridine 3-monooxygenase [Cytospora mali]|uniref:2,6-dihydroxypyridine 3-monooxygenase n=1 Tax=Cytospora mali TaxID=578113 RepID=A0A194V3Z8_CYTMA|nr:2,6-dihydroxypyridine 3-monooxygenase [Valsa mali var. pyri (nom. inval.)]
MHGVHFKREGVNVTILEQDPASERSSHNAGIRIDDNVNEFLRQHDQTGLQTSLESHANFISLRKRENLIKADKGTTRYWTNWGYLYRILRANFDGYASKACPTPPSSKPGDGYAKYLTGKRVTSLQYTSGNLTLQYVDVETGEEHSISSELVIGADGLHSTIRKLVNAPLAYPETYAGFIAWRGAVPRRSVSQVTADYFSNQVSSDLLGQNTYMICYMIPTDEGGFTPEAQLINWVLYQDVAEGSAAEAAIFTDANGHRYQRTVPQGVVDPHTWEGVRGPLVARMAAPFAELVSATTNPFVTKVSDVLGSQASFCDGRVVLVGDALATYRPHAGKATDQAASHCLELAKVWRGDTWLASWDIEACVNAKRMYLWSRLMGEFERGTWFSFFRSIVSYLVFIIRARSRL